MRVLGMLALWVVAGVVTTCVWVRLRRAADARRRLMELRARAVYRQLFDEQDGQMTVVIVRELPLADLAARYEQAAPLGGKTTRIVQ